MITENLELWNLADSIAQKQQDVWQKTAWFGRL